MRSQKIRLKPTRDQESLMRWYSKVLRNYWNLLVDIDKRNNQGEFDDIIEKLFPKEFLIEGVKENFIQFNLRTFGKSIDNWRKSKSFSFVFIIKKK